MSVGTDSHLFWREHNVLTQLWDQIARPRLTQVSNLAGKICHPITAHQYHEDREQSDPHQGSGGITGNKLRSRNRNKADHHEQPDQEEAAEPNPQGDSL